MQPISNTNRIPLDGIIEEILLYYSVYYNIIIIWSDNVDVYVVHSIINNIIPK